MRGSCRLIRLILRRTTLNVPSLSPCFFCLFCYISFSVMLLLSCYCCVLLCVVRFSSFLLKRLSLFVIFAPHVEANPALAARNHTGKKVQTRKKSDNNNNNQTRRKHSHTHTHAHAATHRPRMPNRHLSVCCEVVCCVARCDGAHDAAFATSLFRETPQSHFNPSPVSPSLSYPILSPGPSASL